MKAATGEPPAKVAGAPEPSAENRNVRGAQPPSGHNFPGDASRPENPPVHSFLALEQQREAADLLVAYLEQLGVEYVFGIPGGAIEPLYNALARSERRGKIRHILARHETGAAFMADGYARETGKIGVCCATSGPGATNLITGVACAHENNIPMLVITAQTALPSFGKNPLQDSSCTGIDTVGMFQHCTLYNSLVSHPAQLETKLVSALHKAMQAPRGPVHLSVPTDIFRSPHAAPRYRASDLLRPSRYFEKDKTDELFELLSGSRKIKLVLGIGCADSIDAIIRYAERMNAGIVTTPDGKGMINPRHPLFRGVFGFGGHAEADKALKGEAVDTILAVGISVGEWNSGGWSENLLNERLVHIDESDLHLMRTPMARLHVRGDIRAVFERLLERLPSRPAAPAIPAEDEILERMLLAPGKFHGNATPIAPQRLMRELGRMFPPGTRFFADTGNSTTWAIHYLYPANEPRLGERRANSEERGSSGRRHHPATWLHVSMNFASMGWAIGAAIGAATANRSTRVVCITGDGSMLMNGMELSTAVAEKLDIVIVVLNDGQLGMVKHGQKMAGAERIAYGLPPTDFAALARALGASAYTIRSPEDIDALDIAALPPHSGPVLLDVHVDPDEPPPMSVRMQVLNNSK